jgi:hypothetical protein
VSPLICEGCGRVAGGREVYCGGCGRALAGREAPASDAAPPGWLVSTSARDQAGPWFEPLPVSPVAPPAPKSASPDQTVERMVPAWSGEAGSTDARSVPPPLPPILVPQAMLATAQGPTAHSALATEPAPHPPLRILLVPLLALVTLSSIGAIALLLLHVLHDR